MQNGTAYSTGQFIQVQNAVVAALDGALKGTDPKEVIRVVQSNGRQLERGLRGVVAQLLANYPFKHDMSKYGWKLADRERGMKVLDNEEDYFRLEPVRLSAGFMNWPTIQLFTEGNGIILSQGDAEHILDNTEVFLSEGWMKGKILAFPATVWEQEGGSGEVILRYFPVLLPNPRGWNLGFQPFYWSTGKSPFSGHDPDIFALRVRER